jgi:putative phosphoribosyl transferase
MALFADREDAGHRLGVALQDRYDRDAVVLGLPRGGVPVAFEVAKALDAQLDVIVVRNFGVPSQRELAMGAIGEGGVRVLNDEVMSVTGVSGQELAGVEMTERQELDRRARRFRQGRPPVALEGRNVIVVDDGIATGATARAACEVARAQGAARVVLAVPVAPPDWIRRLGVAADDYVALATPSPFFGVGQFYTDFTQISDADVTSYLDGSRTQLLELDCPSGTGRVTVPVLDEEVEVACGAVRLPGRLTIPADPVGIILFAHGCGSSRHSPRNRYVTAAMHQAGLGTLLFDLLTLDEESDRTNVFDVALLARRLANATKWVRAQPWTVGLPLGFFGASTGAAAALWAAAEPGVAVGAVVLRGGRADLAVDGLDLVTAPTLLIVGSDDHSVVELNRKAAAALRCEHKLAFVPGATHLFEEPGALELVARMARQWFQSHLGQPSPATESVAATYADALIDVTAVMDDIARTFPAVGSRTFPHTPSDDAVTRLADRASRFGDTELAGLLRQWLAACGDFHSRVDVLNEFRDNHHTADAFERHSYTRELHARIDDVGDARRQLQTAADGIKEHIVDVLDAGLRARDEQH